MRHSIRPFILGLALVLAWAGPTRADSVQVFAHLFVVPAMLPDGTPADSQVLRLESWLTDAFGGFTRLGQGLGGWKNERGQVETEPNTAYLVTAPRDFSKEIAGRLDRDFGVRVPYVLALPAGLFAK